MWAAPRTLVASLLVAAALLLGPAAAGAQERPSDPNGCAETPAAEHCQNPGSCADTPGAEHCQNPGGGNDEEVLSGTFGNQGGGGGGGLLSLPRTGAGIATMLLVAAAAIAAGVGFRRSARRA